MKMNTKSWHSHIINQYTDSRALFIENFCPYVRKVIRGIFNILGISAGIILATYMFVFGWVGTAAAIYMQGFSNGMDFIAGHYFIWLAGNIITLLVAFAICVFLFEEHIWSNYRDKKRSIAYDKKQEVDEQKRAGTYVAPKHGLIVTWYKANHDKICPTLDW